MLITSNKGKDMKTTLKYWSFAQKTKHPKESSSLLLMKDVNNKNDKNNLPSKIFGQFIDFLMGIRGNCRTKN